MDREQGPAVHLSAAPLLVSASVAAAILGIGRATLYKLDAAGDIPQARKLGKLRRWSRPELEAWVAAGCPSRVQWARQGGTTP